jgi:hypothetical protein
MLLKHRASGDLVRVEAIGELMDLFKPIVFGMAQTGEEEQERAFYSKEQLIFPSGESLPRSWIDAGYRQAS